MRTAILLLMLLEISSAELVSIRETAGSERVLLQGTEFSLSMPRTVTYKTDKGLNAQSDLNKARARIVEHYGEEFANTTMHEIKLLSQMERAPIGTRVLATPSGGIGFAYITIEMPASSNDVFAKSHEAFKQASNDNPEILVSGIINHGHSPQINKYSVVDLSNDLGGTFSTGTITKSALVETADSSIILHMVLPVAAPQKERYIFDSLLSSIQIQQVDPAGRPSAAPHR